MRRPSPIAAAAAGLMLLAAGAGLARAQEEEPTCAESDLRFGGATYYPALEVGRGRPAAGAELGSGTLNGFNCGEATVVRAKGVNPKVGVLADDPPRIHVATGYLEPLSAHPLHRWLHRRGTPRRPANCTGARMTVTGAASRDFRRDAGLLVRRVRVIVHNRTRTSGITVSGVPRIVRGQRITVAGPACKEGAAVVVIAASSISAAE